MACRAQRNQIRTVIRPLLTSEGLVMNLKVLARAANLTLPPVPFHYLPAESFIQTGIQADARALF